MARRKSTPIHIGIGGSVVAVQATSGEEIWRTVATTAAIVAVTA